MDKKKIKSGSAGNLMDIFQRKSKTQRTPPASTSSSHYTHIHVTPLADISASGDVLKSPESDQNSIISITNLDQAVEYIEEIRNELTVAKVQIATAPSEDLIRNLQSELAAVKAELATAPKEDFLKNIQNELAAAKAELAALRNERRMLKKTSLPLENRFSPLDSSEEEELVEKETAWLFPTTTTSTTFAEAERTRKKRRRTHTKTPPTINTKSADLPQVKTKVPLPPPINEAHKSKKSKLPPVILNDVKNYTKWQNYMSANNIDYQAKLLTDNSIKISLRDEDSYRKLTRSLNENQSSWYSYEDKQNRPIKVILKRLHPSCLVDQIKDDLLQRNFKILEVTQLFKRNVKTPLPIFMLSFDKDEDIKKIYEIKDMLHMKVEIEALRKSKLIPQCKRCQQFGLTQNYCQKTTRCVKCAENHMTKDCKKPKEKNPTCVNCGDPHPANYRGCQIAKKLQEIRNKKETLKQYPVVPKKQQEPVIIVPQQPPKNMEMSYAQVTKRGTQQLNNSENISQLLQKIITRLDDLEQKQNNNTKLIFQRISKLENRFKVAPNHKKTK